MIFNQFPMKPSVLAILLALACLFIPGTAPGQNGKNIDKSWLRNNYTKREVMVPMRDGVKLYTAVYEPSAGVRPGPSPIIMMRTPYSLKPYSMTSPEGSPKPYEEGLKGDMMNYAADGYIIVYQNVRGTYLSEGDYENVRRHTSGRSGGMNRHPDVTDEATDTYDTVEWLLANTAGNGNVGVKGVSYPGFYATHAALSRHPAIKAVSPQAPVSDWFMGDDFHHNGALCLADGYSFGSSMFRARKSPSSTHPGALVRINGDLYDYYLGKPLGELSSFFGDSLAFWNKMVENPGYSRFWKERNPCTHLKKVEPAVLVTGGFFDAEDCYGAFRTYSEIKRLSPDCELFLAAGPWYHGGWNNRDCEHLGDVWYGAGSGAYYQDNVEYPFFSFYLDGKGEPPAGINILPTGETERELMENRPSDNLWKTYSQWPPEGTTYRKLSLADTALIFNGPASDPAHGTSQSRKQFISDPSSPVPYMDIKSASRDRLYMVADQSFAARRPDVLTWNTGIIKDTLHLAGPVKVRIGLTLDSTDDPQRHGRLDADIVVKIIDVRPDGYMMLVRGDTMPLRFRKGFGKGIPTKPGKEVSVEFTMCDIDHRFCPGHRLMIQVQGSWFPLIAMNPQTFVSNPYMAEASDYKPARITVDTEKSCIFLPVCGE